MSSTTGVRGRRMDAFDRREEILSYAIRLFEQQPYADVSLRAIADAAGVARPLLNHYFGDKRELYLEVVRRLTRLPSLAFGDLPKSTPEETAAAIVDHWLRVIANNRRMWIASITLGGPGADSQVQDVIDQGFASVIDRLIPILELDHLPNKRLVRGSLSAYASFTREASRQWLVNGTMSEEEVRRIAVAALLSVRETLVRDAR